MFSGLRSPCFSGLESSPFHPAVLLQLCSLCTPQIGPAFGQSPGDHDLADRMFLILPQPPKVPLLRPREHEASTIGLLIRRNCFDQMGVVDGFQDPQCLAFSLIESLYIHACSIVLLQCLQGNFDAWLGIRGSVDVWLDNNVSYTDFKVIGTHVL